MNFPVVLHKEDGTDYGVTVPDLPGCFSAGRTVDDALAMAQEAIELHLEGLIESGQPVPQPGNIEAYQAQRDYRGGIWAMVSVDEGTLRVKAIRLNITMPERIVDAVDRFAAEHGETRSGLLVRAVTAYIGRSNDQPWAQSSRGRPSTGKKKKK